MDNRQPADNSAQQNPAMPQRRLHVYNRPFADIRPQPQPMRPIQPAQSQNVPVFAPAHQSHMSQPHTTISHPSHVPLPSPVTQISTPPPPKQPQNSIDGFMPPPRPMQFPQTSPQQPAPFTLRHPQQQPVPQPAPIATSAAIPAGASDYQVEMPNDLQEQRQPINAPQQLSNNWHPVQQTQPAPSQPVTTPPQQTPQDYEHQFRANAQMKHGPRFGGLKNLATHGIKAMAVLIFIAGVIVAVNMIRANQATNNAAGNFNQAEKDDLGIFNTPPDESQSTGTLGASRSIDAPKTVTIKAIDLAARVVTVGTSRNSIVKAPSNIYDLGWYEGSAKPGQKGAVLLHGHISGPTRPGAMYEVALLKRGDVISVERGDGKVYNYTVQAVEFFENDAIDMSKLLTPYNPNRNGLNIMTAGGRFNTETNAYELRAAVYAVEDTN